MTLQIGEMTILAAFEDQTGWRRTMDEASTNSAAKLRSGPSINLPHVAVLQPGVRIVRIGLEENGWVPVAALGWVSKELLGDA
jgi:uncharacterized protein YraI